MDKWSDQVFYYNKGHQQRQQAASAVVSYKRAFEIDPKINNAAAYDYLGTLLYEHKSYAKAEKFFHRAYIRISYIPEISCYWGLCLLKIKKYKQAAEKFRIVIADPFRCIARAPCELGRALFHQHLYHEALEVLEKDALRNPLGETVNGQYQKALFYVGNFEKALEMSTESLKKSYSQDSTTKNIRGLLFLIEGCEEEAIKCFEKAANSNKEDTYAWVNWSMLLLQQGKTREAVQILKKGIDFIEEGVNRKDEIQEIIGHYKHLSDMFEKKSLLMRYEKEKSGLERTSSMMRLVIEYLENPNLNNIFVSICSEEEEEKAERPENEISNSNQEDLEVLENPQIQVENQSDSELHDDKTNQSGDSILNEETQQLLKNEDETSNDQNTDPPGMINNPSIDKNKDIPKKYGFIVAGIILIFSIIIFYKVLYVKKNLTIS